MQFDGTTQDITEKKRGAEERDQLLLSEQAARIESERAGRMKDEFLATLSHELRTPLNAILGWSHLLSGNADKETLKEGLDVIERNARVQVQLIEDLLDMSRIISGKIRLDIQSVEVAALIGAALETVRPAAQAKGIQLEQVLDAKVGPIAGDPARLQQVIWNLLSNAIRFTPKGGKVQVLIRSVESGVDITVADSGQGIDAGFLPHIFERFRQADASTSRSHGGLGLGLSIVKQLVELHGGTISASSAGRNLGSTFKVSLPVPRSYREHAADRPARRNELTAGVFREMPVALKGMTVLVVDDELDARNLVKRVLEECGATVVTAGSAAEAIGMVPSLKPNILVSDIGMPGVDGYELLRRVRELGPLQGGDVPAIALTAFARADDRACALVAGYSVHISKPIEPAELIATVAMVGGRSTPSRHSVSAGGPTA